MMPSMTHWKHLLLALVVYTSCEACVSNYVWIVTCGTSHGTWIVVFDNIKTFTGCVTLCQFRSTCWSILYHPGSQECKLNAELADVAENITCDFEYAWVTNSSCRAVGVLGSQCRFDSHCTNAGNMECLSNTCACKPGHVVRNSTCDYECGSTFDVYPGYAMSGFNDRSITYSMTAQECLDMCVLERDFMCRSADWASDGCFLSTETRFTQPQAAYIGQFDHYVRRCD